MTKKHFFNPATFIALIVGAITGALIMLIIGGGKASPAGESTKSNQPLYWVAPMDPNFRRDKPGKSPMGMDLVPVYEEDAASNDAGPGTISISPSVVNNLGVRTGMVESKTLDSEIVTVGFVRYDEDKLIHIHPRISGWVENLYIKAAGDPVQKGDPLYALYSPELVNAQEELLLALNRNNRRLVEASENRLTALQIPKDFINNLKKTLTVKQTITFYAPQTGVVDNLNVREGFFVQPGTTMLSIGVLDPVWVEAEVFERQAALVKLGDPVTMTLDYLPGKTWNGQVDYIYPTLDNQTRTVRLRLRFENPNHLLKPNMFAQITVHTHTDEQVLVVPRESLIRTGHQDRVVLALGNGSFKSVAVKVGRQDQDWIEILRGLNEGEEVVTSAQFLLDSESSKTSDFKRMQEDDEQIQSAKVSGVINSVDKAARTVNISRGPIEKWNRPAATLDFEISENLNIKQLKEGGSIFFEFEIRDGDFVITRLLDEDSLDHSNMDHSNMDHSNMDHSNMESANHQNHGGEE